MFPSLEADSSLDDLVFICGDVIAARIPGKIQSKVGAHYAAWCLGNMMPRYPKYATTVIGAHSVPRWYETLDRLVTLGQLQPDVFPSEMEHPHVPQDRPGCSGHPHTQPNFFFFTAPPPPLCRW